MNAATRKIGPNTFHLTLGQGLDFMEAVKADNLFLSPEDMISFITNAQSGTNIIALAPLEDYLLTLANHRQPVGPNELSTILGLIGYARTKLKAGQIFTRDALHDMASELRNDGFLDFPDATDEATYPEGR